MSRVVVQTMTQAAVPAEADLSRWAELALAETERRGEVVLRLVDEAESRLLNKQYRGKDYATNVLSFPSEPLDDMPAAMAAEFPLGDLVVCAPVVNAEAQEQDKQNVAHWAHMVIHGCLHLQGYDHIDAAEAEEMEALERRLLAQLSFPDPYE